MRYFPEQDRRNEGRYPSKEIGKFMISNRIKQ